VFISFLAAVSCQNRNPGFFFNGPALLGLNNNGLNGGLNNGLNSGLNSGLNRGFSSGLNGNGLNNGFGLNSGLNNGFSGGFNGLNNNNGFLLNNDNTGLNNVGANQGGLMGMILGGNNNNLQGQASNQQNSYPGLPQVPALPMFTDALNYPPQGQGPQSLPVPQASALTTPTLADYGVNGEIPMPKSGFPLLAPGRLSTLGLPGLAPVPDLPVVASNPVDLSGSRSLTANLRNEPSLTGPNLNGPLFPNGVPGGTNMANMANNANANNANNNNLLNNGFLNNNSLLSNGLLNNNGAQLANNGLLNNGLQNGSDKSPIEVSQYSTQIVHNTPARAALSKGN